MAEPKALDTISESDFRNLTEAPISNRGEAPNGSDTTHVVAAGGEALEPNTLGDEGNTFGGQTQSGEAGGPADIGSGGDLDVRGGFAEVLETDLEDAVGGNIASPEDADMNSPGEVDVETLGDDALRDTDIPRDALLDPLEE